MTDKLADKLLLASLEAKLDALVSSQNAMVTSLAHIASCSLKGSSLRTPNGKGRSSLNTCTLRSPQQQQHMHLKESPATAYSNGVASHALTSDKLAFHCMASLIQTCENLRCSNQSCSKCGRTNHNASSPTSIPF
jgi:hypothetical protein